MTHAPTPPQTPFADQRPIGFDKLMPEGHRAPWRFFPSPSASLSVTFGAPLPEASVPVTPGMGSSVRGSRRDDDDGDGRNQGGYFEREAMAEIETRIAITSCCAPLKFSVGRCPGTCSLGHHISISKGPGYEWDSMFCILNRSHRKGISF